MQDQKRLFFGIIEEPTPFAPVWEWWEYLARLEAMDFHPDMYPRKPDMVREARCSIALILASDAAYARGVFPDDQIGLGRVIKAHWQHGITDPEHLAEAALNTLGKPQ